MLEPLLRTPGRGTTERPCWVQASRSEMLRAESKLAWRLWAAMIEVLLPLELQLCSVGVA